MAYFSKKYSLKEYNYEIYNKIFLIIIKAFKKWRPEFKNAKYLIIIITDY